MHKLIGSSLKIAGRLAPGATSAVVQRLLFTPHKGRLRQSEEQILQSAKITRHGAADNEVCHYEWGVGPRRILLVHGWSGHAGQMTSFVKPLLGAGCHVITLDLPAHGKSSGNTASVVHFKKAIQHAEQVYGAFHGVVAHSLGAASLAIAVSEGMLCERAVFCGPVATFEFIWEQSKHLLGISDKVMDLTVQRAEKWLGIRFDEISPAALARTLSPKLLIVHDRDDRNVPLQGGQALASSWPGAQLWVTEKLGHLDLLHDAEVVRRSVLFLTADLHTVPN